jgi:hypothetical protein
VKRLEQGIVDLLQNGLNLWNTFFGDIQAQLQTTPDAFAGGGPWSLVSQINHGLQGIGYGLLILFFLLSFFKTTTNFKELSLQQIIGWMVRFILVKFLIDYSIDLLNFIISISMGVNSVIFQFSGTFMEAQVPQDVINAAQAVTDAGFGERLLALLQGIPLALLAFIGVAVIWVAGIIMVVVVYLRFFKVFIYSAIAPIPLSVFGSPETSTTGKHFLKAYAAVCLEICVIALACVIYNAIMSNSALMFDSWTSMGGNSVNDQFWGVTLNYVLSMAIQTILLATVVVSSNRFIKEIIGV